MRILFLDDDHNRHGHFAKTHAAHDIFHVYTYDEFVTALDENERFDEIWLDHDLAWIGSELDPREKTGYDAACYLAETPGKYPSLVVIHSWNPIGATRMRQVLQLQAGLTPLVRPFAV